MRKKLIMTYSCILCFGVIFFLGGCAAGNKYSYHNVSANITASGDKTIGVATHDQREYVLSGKKSPDFIGLQRGGFGNPFDVSTASGRSLAEDMTKTISSSLSNKGFKTIPVIVLPSDNANTVLAKLKATPSELFVLFTLNEWKSDSLTSVTLIYDVTLKVYNKMGVLLAEKSLKGRDYLGEISGIRLTYAKKAVPDAFKQKIEELFNNPDITNALR